ncbi:MAG: hypothetical protein VZQ47_02235 [Treponema sp.]|nr:hypothetical protein [Treponema sp.]MEE3434360.1 hypothetical protein [Treponema sp.]
MFGNQSSARHLFCQAIFRAFYMTSKAREFVTTPAQGKRIMNTITKNAPSCGCVRLAPLDNCATRALRLETFYVCRCRGMRNAIVATSRPAPSRIFLLLP